MVRSMNAVTVTGVDYAPDPHGGWLFSSLARSAAASINGQRPIHDRAANWHGPVPTVQQFRGAAGLRAVGIYAPKAATINEQVSTQDSPVQAAFLDRMRRGQS